MILTITLNPSVDMNYQLDDLHLDGVNRVDNISKTAGGKGLNVARVLRQLDMDTAASGYLGGHLGDFIRTEIKKMNITDAFVSVADATRNCIAIIHNGGKQTEVLESGPTISESEAAAFITAFKEHIKDVDIITISGSLPKGLSADFYVELLKIAAAHEKSVLLDANGNIMKAVLADAFKPFLIKPNEHEFADLIGVESVGEADVKQAVQAEMFADIPYVVVTRGKDSAIVKARDAIYRVSAPTIEAVNAVGSGDSVVAGFAAGLQQGLEGEALLKFGLAMGVLNALEEKTGHINPEGVDDMVTQMSVEKIK